jgi:flagellar biosynthesis protein FlhF
VAQLEAASLSHEAVEIVIREANGERSPARAIARVLDAREVTYPEADSTGIVVVLGAPGSGRTTALMKMALDCADSGREAILVAADSQRMGARQQIHAFAEATGLEVLDAHDARGVSALAARATRGACLFVDVPAGGFDPPPMPGIVNYAYLAVPAHWQTAALESAIESLGDVSFDGCILTFTDLAPSLAASLSLVIDSPLGLAFASAGRDVSDGMGELDVEQLVYGLFPLLTGERTNGNLVATA